jgi:hypothetical protein
MAQADMLRRDAEALLALKQRRSARQDVERCELCSRELGPAHPHLVETVARRIVCSCDACALLFEGRNEARYRRIPRDVVRLPDSLLDDVDWNSLSIPISLAFFFFSSAAGRMMAMYPSPAGATESELPLDAWNAIAAREPRVQQLQPDVEALLVNRLRTPAACYIAPIDRCYELTGTIRKHWKGFSGGDELWREVDAYFARLDRERVGAGREHAGSAL